VVSKPSLILYSNSSIPVPKAHKCPTAHRLRKLFYRHRCAAAVKLRDRCTQRLLGRTEHV